MGKEETKVRSIRFRESVITAIQKAADDSGEFTFNSYLEDVAIRYLKRKKYLTKKNNHPSDGRV